MIVSNVVGYSHWFELEKEGDVDLKRLAATAYIIFLSVMVSNGAICQEATEEELQQSVEELTAVSDLIKQVGEEKKQVKGSEAKALSKQQVLARQYYRDLLWKFVDDLATSPNKDEFKEVAVVRLLQESEVLKKEIEKGLAAIAELEEKLVADRDNFTRSGQARRTSLQARLKKKQKAQDKLYSALVKNAGKLNKTGQDSSEDIAVAKSAVTKQADLLSGQIGLEEDKLTALERKLSVVSSESKTGKELLTRIRSQDLLIQNEARRLQNMADLLEAMEVDASLYHKRAIQSSGRISGDILDQKVISHLFNEWWLNTRKWLAKQGPELLGKTATFIVIFLLAYLLASIIRRMLARIFQRTLPEMSELAKNFIISMSSKLLILAGLLLALSNIGVQIGPILAGLGIMGFVVGFALQDTLSNFAAGMMILIYRPFDVGDKIKSAGVKGKVNKMNLVSTTVFTSENHQLTVPNRKIWGDIIHNITSQPLQRLDLYFSVPFNADSAVVQEAIAAVVDSCPDVVDDKAKSVRIHELGETVVKYLARFWVSTDDVNEAQWAISEGVKKRFDEEGISLVIVEAAS